MLCLGHGKFREILIQTGESKGKNGEERGRTGKNVFVVTEEYMSKTCCKCGALHLKLGGNTRLKCPVSGCGFHADGEIHVVFNIFLSS